MQKGKFDPKTGTYIVSERQRSRGRRGRNAAVAQRNIMEGQMATDGSNGNLKS